MLYLVRVPACSWFADAQRRAVVLESDMMFILPFSPSCYIFQQLQHHFHFWASPINSFGVVGFFFWQKFQVGQLSFCFSGKKCYKMYLMEISLFAEISHIMLFVTVPHSTAGWAHCVLLLLCISGLWTVLGWMCSRDMTWQMDQVRCTPQGDVDMTQAETSC